MTPAQIDACVQRMPAGAAIRFCALQAEATQLVSRAWELRLEAWEIYRPWRGRGSKIKASP